MGYMTRTTRLAVALAVPLTFGGPALSDILIEPQSVPLDFLSQIDGGTDWLRGALAAQGYPGDYTIENETLTTQEGDILAAVNIIRAFANGAQGASMHGPIARVKVLDQSGPQICLTSTLSTVHPGVAPEFFASYFEKADAEGTGLRGCVAEDRQNPYWDMDHIDIREMFDDSGVLLPEHEDLVTDTDFIHRLIELGFYVSTDGFSGRLQVEL